MTRCTVPIVALALLIVIPGCGFAGIDLGSPSDHKGSGGPPGPTMSSGEYAEALAAHDATNARRAAVGAPPLVWDATAAQIAYEHCADMRVRGFYDHLNPDGLWGSDRLGAAGITYWSVGENIWRTERPAGGGDAVQAFMGSTPHRATLLSTGYTHVGIGMHSDGNRTWWTQVFLTPR